MKGSHSVSKLSFNRRRAVWAIARKDMLAIGANIQVWLPMLILPIMFGVLIPGGLLWALSKFGAGSSQLGEITQVLDQLPQSYLSEKLASFDSTEQQVAYFALNYLLAPLFLLIPLMAASVVSADSFAGEKERGTLEGLLFSPADVLTIFIGKVLAALLPAVMLSLATFALTGIVANVVGWPLMGHLFFPNANWIPLMLLVIPALSLAGILVNVFVSARVATFQAAYQVGGLVVLPIIALVVGQVTGVLLLDFGIVLAIGLLLAVIDGLLLLLLRRQLDRTQLFESQVR